MASDPNLVLKGGTFMATYIIGYAVIILLIAFIVFSVLVKKKVLFGNTIPMQRIFANPLLHYSIKRVLSSLISIALAMLVTFFLIRLAKPADQTCGTLFDRKNEALFLMQCQAWKEAMGMSGSIFEQLLKFFYSMIPFPKLICKTEFTTVTINGIDQVRGVISECRTVIFNLGRIYKVDNVADGYLVTDYLLSRAAVSFRIGIFAVIIELALGYPFGILMAKYQNGVFDRIGKGYIMIIDAIPGVAYYYIWMAILCNLIKLPFQYDAADIASYLPAILTMGITGMSGIGLWVRRYMVDEFNADYVKFARSKGLKENRIMTIHILRNAVVPLVRTFPSAVIGALLGSYFIENMYGIPGIGNALMLSQNTSNVWLIQGIILFSAILSVLSYLFGDIVTAAVDPRISFEA